ncbi:hypothetical protein GCM10027168_07250 [Streptomyces capparidis]
MSTPTPETGGSGEPQVSPGLAPANWVPDSPRPVTDPNKNWVPDSPKPVADPDNWVPDSTTDDAQR